MKKYYTDIIILLPLLLLTFLVRTYRLQTPLADWHSWRQADTAAVARNFVKEKFNILYPQSDSFLAFNSQGLENPNRWFINEFPFYNAVVALIYKQFGINHIYGRLVSIFFATLGAMFLYLLTNKLFNRKVAILAGLYYALNPYNIYYGRVVMPDPTFVSLSIISLYLTVKWVETKKVGRAIAFASTFALAMLVKPYAIFMLIPILYWLYANWGKKVYRDPKIYSYLIASFIPLLLWRLHLHSHPEGTFASAWLMNGDGIRFTGAFFRWMVFERLNRIIFATGGFVLLIIGVLRSHLTKNGKLMLAWFLSVIAYFTVFAKGNVTHDYYQLPVMPVGAILVALGFFEVVNWAKGKWEKRFNIVAATFLFVLSLAFGWYEIRGYFNINNQAIVEAGQKADEILPQDAIVITPYQGDPAFLYQTNRYGWPDSGDINDKIKKGADYYITTSRDHNYNSLIKTFPILYENDNFSIIDLTKTK